MPITALLDLIPSSREPPIGEDLWNSQGVFGDPLTTKPTPVVRIRPETVTEGQLADDNETTPGAFVPPIDGHLYGNDAQLGSIRHYGVGHPAAVLHTLQDGSNEIWLYYWDSVVHRMSRIRSQDGIYFDPADRLVTNLTHPSHIKYFPDLELDGQQGVWIGTSIFAGRRWFEYSFDGELFQATTAILLEESFALGIANTGYLCPVPGAGSFVSDRYGHVQGTRKFGFLSGEGFRSLNENGAQLGCHHPDEDQLRGSTWGIYYLEGDFSDVDITNESCEDASLGQPYGLVSQGTTIPGWQVDIPSRTGRNWVEKTDSGDIFPMPFFNNGIPMDGIHVCLLKQQSSMTQSLDGFTPGREYRVRAWANSRTAFLQGHFPTPIMRIELGGVVVEPGASVPAVDLRDEAENAFREAISSGTFLAGSSGPYDLVIRQLEAGDPTLLIDRVIVEEVPAEMSLENESCEQGILGQPYGLVSQGTTLPGW